MKRTALDVAKDELAHRSLNKTNWAKRRHTISSIDGIVAAGPIATVVGNHEVATRSTNYQTYADEVGQIGNAARLKPDVTPLMIAIEQKRNDAVRDMLSNAGHVLGNASRYPYPPRANVHTRDQYGETALHYAAKSKPEYMEMLLKAGADPDARNARGQTPMYEAVRADSSEKLEILLKYGASVNVRDRFMKTPLHNARAGHSTKLLLENGAEVDARDRWRKTPLYYAVPRRGSLGAVKVLLKHGANVHGGGGETPLSFAERLVATSSSHDQIHEIAVLLRQAA